MAITVGNFVVTTLATGSGAPSGGHLVTSSITPVAGDLTILSFSSSGGSSGVTAVSGCNLTWTKIASVSAGIGIANAPNDIAVWYGVGGSPSAGTITVSTGSINTCYYQLIDVSGEASSTPIVQHSTGIEGTLGASVVVSPSLSSLGANNVAMAFATAGQGSYPGTGLSAGTSMQSITGTSYLAEVSSSVGSPTAVNAVTNTTKGIIVAFEIAVGSVATNYGSAMPFF